LNAKVVVSLVIDKGSANEPRTRISCHAALDDAARAPSSKERRMKFAKATKFHRKSGEGGGLKIPQDAILGRFTNKTSPARDG
jgi:hypothetical protein